MYCSFIPWNYANNSIFRYFRSYFAMPLVLSANIPFQRNITELDLKVKISVTLLIYFCFI
jgi:hypothetical protein